MCLALPARLIEKRDDLGIVELSGVKKEISLALLNDEDIAVGDYVIVHVGYALTRLDTEEAERTLALFDEMAVAMAAGEGGA